MKNLEKEINEIEKECYETTMKFVCEYVDEDHDEPWGCQYEFPGPDECDNCPFASWK